MENEYMNMINTLHDSQNGGIVNLNEKNGVKFWITFCQAYCEITTIRIFGILKSKWLHLHTFVSVF